MYKYFKKQKNLSKGFSLVEMLVAIAVFMSVMTIAVSALITIISSNKKAQAIKTTTDNVTFSIENISRDMRLGTSYACLLNSGFKDCTVGNTKVAYINASNHAVIYSFNKNPGDINGSLTKKECTTNSISSCVASADVPVDLISLDSNVKINNMTFYVIGSDNESNPNTTMRTQPRVVITVSGLVSVKGSADTTFNLQTNISQRSRGVI
jgi:type II secretory pathway pseudopilin PulG